MTYRPSLKDLNMQSEDQSYQPKLSDIGIFNQSSSNEMNDEEKRKMLLNLTGYGRNLLTYGQDVLQGLGNAGAGIAKTLTGGYAPDMPNISSENPNALIQGLAQYAPFGLAGGGSLLGQLGAGGAFGFSQYDPNKIGLADYAAKKLGVPEGFGENINKYFAEKDMPNIPGRVRNALEDATINALLHQGLKFKPQESTAPKLDMKLSAQFKAGESEFSKIPEQIPSSMTASQPPALSENIANTLHSEISGGRTLEQSGKELASNINRSYLNVKNLGQQNYNNVLNADSGQMSYQTGEPIKVKDIGMYDSNYVKHYSDKEIPDANVKMMHDKYIENKNIDNAHRLQSELGGEIGYLKKQKDNEILDSVGKNKLNEYIKMQETLQNDINHQLKTINPKFENDYIESGNWWRKNVRPYYSDKNLREIAEGRIKNPTSSQVIDIFKNPEESINKVVADIGSEGKNRIVHIGLGKGEFENTAKDLLSAREGLHKQGLTSYVEPYHEQNFRALKRNVQAEENIQSVIEKNKKAIDELRAAQKRSEQSRIKIANQREKNRELARKESEKIIEKKQKEFNKQMEEIEKMKNKKAIDKANMIRSLLFGGLGAAVVHSTGITPEQLMGAYLAKEMKKKIIKK